jgi:hypothetical protein
VIVARLLGVAVALALGVCVVLYLATGERRYLRMAWGIFRGALFLLVVFLLLIFGERLVKEF